MNKIADILISTIQIVYGFNNEENKLNCYNYILKNLEMKERLYHCNIEDINKYTSSTCDSSIMINGITNYLNSQNIKTYFDNNNLYIDPELDEINHEKIKSDGKQKKEKTDKKELKNQNSKWKFYSTGNMLSIKEAIEGLDSYLSRSSDEYRMTEEQKIEFVSKYSRQLLETDTSYQISVDGLFDDVREFLGIKEDDSDDDKDENDKNEVYTYSFGSLKNGILDVNVFSSRDKLLKFLQNSSHHKDMKKQVLKDFENDLNVKEYGYQSVDGFYIQIKILKIDDDDECSLHVRNEDE